MAALWLPGQAHLGQPRLWWAASVLPAVLFITRARSVWLWPWIALVSMTLLNVPFDRAAIVPAVHQIGWLAALSLGLALGTDGFAHLSARYVPAAGVLATLMGVATGAAPFGNRTFLATFIAGTLLWTARGLRSGPHWRWIAVVIQLGGLIWGGSLGAWLGLLLGGAVWLAEGRGPWHRVALIGALVLAGALASQSDPVRQHLSGRLHVAKISAQIANSARPLGVGPGRLHGAFLDAQAGHATGEWTNAYHAHNEALQITAEQGLTGLLLLLLPLVVALWRGRGAARALVVTYCAVGAVSLPLYEPGAALLGCLAVGVCLAPRQMPGPPRRRWLLEAAVVSISLAGVGLATTELVADRLLYAGVATHELSLLLDAGALAGRPAAAWQHAAEHLSKDGKLDRARTLAKRALSATPSVEGWMLLGRIEMAARRQRAAIEAFKQASRLHPRLFAAHFNLARAYEELGDRPTARRHAIRARSLRPTDPRLRWLPR